MAFLSRPSSRAIDFAKRAGHLPPLKWWARFSTPSTPFAKSIPIRVMCIWATFRPITAVPRPATDRIKTVGTSDIGMYAKGNRPLDTLVVMNEENMDVAKTWCLIENIIRSQRVQYIFLDRRIQKILYDYALSHGSESRLSRPPLRGREGGSISARFAITRITCTCASSPLGPRLRPMWMGGSRRSGMVIEMAQQAYLPKRVKLLCERVRAQPGQSGRELRCVPKRALPVESDQRRHRSDAGEAALFSINAGSKRSPSSWPKSLQPGFISEAPPMHLASVRSSTESVSDAAQPVREFRVREKKVVEEKRVEAAPEPTSPPIRSLYMVRRGDNVDRISRRTGIDVKTLCLLNGIKKDNPCYARSDASTHQRQYASRGNRGAFRAIVSGDGFEESSRRAGNRREGGSGARSLCRREGRYTGKDFQEDRC